MTPGSKGHSKQIPLNSWYFLLQNYRTSKQIIHIKILHFLLHLRITTFILLNNSFTFSFIKPFHTKIQKNFIKIPAIIPVLQQNYVKFD
jgi:hypothetical protein